MASWVTVDIDTMRWSPISQSHGNHCQRPSHGNWEESREAYSTKPLIKIHYKWRSKGKRNYCWMSSPTEWKSSFPVAYEMATEIHTDIVLLPPAVMATGKSSKDYPKHSAEWLSPRCGPLGPYWMLNQEMVRSANAMYKAAFPGQTRSGYTVSGTNQNLKALVMDQWYATHTRCNWGPLGHPRVVPASGICESQTQCLLRYRIAISKVKMGSMWLSTISLTWLWLIPMMLYASTLQ